MTSFVPLSLKTFAVCGEDDRRRIGAAVEGDDAALRDRGDERVAGAARGRAGSDDGRGRRDVLGLALRRGRARGRRDSRRAGRPADSSAASRTCPRCQARRPHPVNRRCRANRPRRANQPRRANRPCCRRSCTPPKERARPGTRRPTGHEQPSASLQNIIADAKSANGQIGVRTRSPERAQNPMGSRQCFRPPRSVIPCPRSRPLPRPLSDYPAKPGLPTS